MDSQGVTIGGLQSYDRDIRKPISCCVYAVPLRECVESEAVGPPPVLGLVENSGCFGS